MTTGSILKAVAGLTVMTAASMMGYALWPTKTRSIDSRIGLQDQAAIARGKYIADASGCFACHTAPSGDPFAGGLNLQTPIGTIYTSNITPELNTGIGTYTLDDFDRAVRHGIRKDGDSLYPAMPYPSYARLTDKDVADLYAFFMKGVPAVVAQNKANAVPYILSFRWPLALWRKTFAPDVEKITFNASKYPDAQIARGAYLVQSAGHCGACHTPRSMTLAEKGLDETVPDYLAGGQLIDGWVAVNLRGNAAEGLGRWSKDDIVAILKSGRNPHSSSVGAPMNDAIVHSTQKLSVPDAEAIAAYLKFLPPASGEVASFASNDATAKMLAKGESNGRGAEIYVDSCSACHFSNGLGSRNAIPALAGNISILASDPTTIIRVILKGARLPATVERPAQLGMPGFGWRYSDDEIAALCTFLRSSWGNSASAVTPGAVRKVRKELEANGNATSVIGLREETTNQ